jgi:hypothetical protein
MGTSSTFVHINKVIFPEPEIFKLEQRWNEKHLEKYGVAFGKGSRARVGIEYNSNAL